MKHLPERFEPDEQMNVTAAEVRRGDYVFNPNASRQGMPSCFDWTGVQEINHLKDGMILFRALAMDLLKHPHDSVAIRRYEERLPVGRWA